MLKYDAKANKQQLACAIRNFTSYVKTVTTAIVPGIVQASAPPRRAAPPAEADVKGATLLIPAPGLRHTQIELIARPACRLPGAAEIRTAEARGPDQQRSDLRPGPAEPMAPDDVARAIEKAFGTHIPEAKKASVKTQQAGQAGRRGDLRGGRRCGRSGLSGAGDQVVAVVDRGEPAGRLLRRMRRLRVGAEVTQLYQSDAFRALDAASAAA